MTSTYGSPQVYGVPPGPFPEALFEKIGRAILCVAAGDGTITPAERRYAIGLAKALGGSPKAVEQQRTFEPRGQRLEDHFSSEMKPMAKVILYDAIRIARVDGFAQKERDIAIKGAKRLGLDATIVPQIEALLAVEDGVRQARLSVLWPDQLTTGAPKDASVYENDFWRYEQFGQPGLIPADAMVDVGKSILVVAGADGDLTETELAWFFGMGKAFGVPDPIIEQVMKFDYRGTRLEETLTAKARPYARVILYDAVRCAASDGFADRERTMAYKAARLLKLDEGIVPWIEGTIGLENATRQARIRLLSPST